MAEATIAPGMCSCGKRIEDCPELGWPHGWDPIAAGDDCVITPPPPVQVLTIDPETLEVEEHGFSEYRQHKVREPYERWGSGYACSGCIDIFAPSARP